MTDNQRGLIEDSIRQIESRAGIVWTAEFLEDYAAALRALLAENAALKAHDPLAEMWRELAEYQPMADADGHGESWARMCQARTEEAASEAYRARQASSHVAAAAYGALWAEQRDAAVRRLSKEAVAWAADAVVAIRRAKEER
jgi:hypothetical protein